MAHAQDRCFWCKAKDTETTLTPCDVNGERALECEDTHGCNTRQERNSTPVIDDPRDTNLASDCAPTFIVEYGWKGQRETYKVQSIQHGKKFISEAKEMEHPDSYSGPYYIHESRIRHEE